MREGRFCLSCMKANSACKCEDKSKSFAYSNRLRVPSDPRKRSVWRLFLRQCPTFVNLVPIELRGDFREFLRDIKMFETNINGNTWTYVNINKEDDSNWWHEYRATELIRAKFRALLAEEKKKLEFYEEIMKVANKEELIETFKKFKGGR